MSGLLEPGSLSCLRNILRLLRILWPHVDPSSYPEETRRPELTLAAWIPLRLDGGKTKMATGIRESEESLNA